MTPPALIEVLMGGIASMPFPEREVVKDKPQ